MNILNTINMLIVVLSVRNQQGSYDARKCIVVISFSNHQSARPSFCFITSTIFSYIICTISNTHPLFIPNGLDKWIIILTANILGRVIISLKSNWP